MSPSSAAKSAPANGRKLLLFVVPLLLLAVAVWVWQGRAAAPTSAKAGGGSDNGSGEQASGPAAAKGDVVPGAKIEGAGGKPQAAVEVVLPPQDLPQLPLVDMKVERTKDMEILKVVLPQSAPSFIACVGRFALKPGTIEPGLHALIQVGPGPAGKSIVTGVSFAGG